MLKSGQETGCGSHCVKTQKPSNGWVKLTHLRTAGMLIVPILQIRKFKLTEAKRLASNHIPSNSTLFPSKAVKSATWPQDLGNLGCPGV